MGNLDRSTFLHLMATPWAEIITQIDDGQGIWSGTPWSGAIQNSGVFWMEMRSANPIRSANPECNPKLRPILDWSADCTPKISECQMP